jgi:phospholipase C
MPFPLNDARVEHLVVLMMENRSFDHMIGLLKDELPDVRGVAPGDFTNSDTVGNPVELTNDAVYQGQFTADPGHDFNDVYLQMYGTPFNGVFARTPTMSGFVKSYEQQAGVSRGAAVMRCFKPERLPTLATLAREYAICDQWFSSVPGPTLPNRAFAHFGTSFGRLDMSPDFFRAQPSIYQRLRRAGKKGKIYYYSQSSGTQGMTFLLADQRDFFGLFGDFKKACKNNELPAYSFIEPAYSDNAGELATDQHPDHNVLQGDNFIRQVYNAIRSNDDGWKRTMLVVVWDEHGGLFDHEIPPAVLPDDFSSTAPPFAFDRLGVRVPAVIVSPYIDAQVEHSVYEHASIPATVTEQFIGDPRTESLHSREKRANTFLHLFTRGIDDPRSDTPDFGAVKTGSRSKARPTGADPASSLHLNQVRELQALLMRIDPAFARTLEPQAVATEAEANMFISTAMNAIHRDPA